jgi:hypothetical protein
MVDYSFPEGLLTPLAVNHFQVTGYTLSPAGAGSLHRLSIISELERELQTQQQLSWCKCRGKAQRLTFSEVAITSPMQTHGV